MDLTCDVEINNFTGFDLTLSKCWYHVGAAEDGWPVKIEEDDKIQVKNGAGPGQFYPGVAGYVSYDLKGDDFTVAFSNQMFGYNRLDVGSGGKDVFDEMMTRKRDPEGEPWTETLVLGGRVFSVQCYYTGGAKNECRVNIYHTTMPTTPHYTNGRREFFQ